MLTSRVFVYFIYLYLYLYRGYKAKVYYLYLFVDLFVARLAMGFRLLVLFRNIVCILYIWFKYDLGQKYHASQVQPDRGSNS